MNETIFSRPRPQRPANGLLAWQATIGYLRYQYDLNAVLSIEGYPLPGGAMIWSAAAIWGQSSEKVADRASLADALRDLWDEVDRKHLIFESPEALAKRPANYADDEWLDTDTHAILNQTLDLIYSVYGSDWTLALVYQPVEVPSMRFQVDLLTRQRKAQMGGFGPTMLEACRDLYRSAAHKFLDHAGKKTDHTT
jgi:hypothetical protein